MRWTIEPIWLDLPSSPDIASEAERDESRTAFIAVDARSDRVDALAGQLARLARRVGGLAGGVGGGVDGLGHLGRGAGRVRRPCAAAPRRRW